MFVLEKKNKANIVCCKNYTPTVLFFGLLDFETPSVMFPTVNYL